MPKNELNQVPNSGEAGQWNASSIRAVIGLGNAGAEHKDTYHSIGLNAVDWLRRNNAQEKAAAKRVGGVFEYCTGKKAIWIKSLTFMNQSGAAVGKALRYFDLRPEEILIIHDDSDLEIGHVKLSWDRGSAGHKGMESVIKSLGTKKLWRLRVGIRSDSQFPSHGALEKRRQKASEFVLKKIGKKNMGLLTQAVKNAAKTLGLASS